MLDIKFIRENPDAVKHRGLTDYNDRYRSLKAVCAAN